MSTATVLQYRVRDNAVQNLMLTTFTEWGRAVMVIPPVLIWSDDEEESGSEEAPTLDADDDDAVNQVIDLFPGLTLHDQAPGDVSPLRRHHTYPFGDI
jgi:hypothetical protein